MVAMSCFKMSQSDTASLSFSSGVSLDGQRTDLPLSKIPLGLHLPRFTLAWPSAVIPSGPPPYPQPPPFPPAALASVYTLSQPPSSAAQRVTHPAEPPLPFISPSYPARAPLRSLCQYKYSAVTLSLSGFSLSPRPHRPSPAPLGPVSTSSRRAPPYGPPLTLLS